MIRIHISAAAYAALVDGRSPDRLLPTEPAPQGGFYLWLLKPLADALMAARAPGESYSDAIVRLAGE